MNNQQKLHPTDSELDKTPSVRQLRRDGSRVRVVHRRFYENLHVPVTKEQASGIKMILDIGNVYPRGGITEVYIGTGKKTVCGFAECSIMDNFNRIKGTKLAIARALATK